MNGKTIAVETPTTVMSLLHFESGADIIFAMSWDVWKHGHPPIELYGTEGSLRVPDPNFFGGAVQYTEKGGDWISVPADDRPFGKPNWRSPNWADHMPNQANYRCLGIAELGKCGAARHAAPLLRRAGEPRAGGDARDPQGRRRRRRDCNALARRATGALSDVDAMALWGEETF